MCDFVSGRIKVLMDDGREIEYRPGGLAIRPPGHDAWMLGGEACVVVDWLGLADCAKRWLLFEHHHVRVGPRCLYGLSVFGEPQNRPSLTQVALRCLSYQLNRGIESVSGGVLMAIDEARVEALVGQLAGHMTGGGVCLGMWLGDELGLYRSMAGKGPLGADFVAAGAGCNPRLTREWLDSQAAAGLVEYDSAADTYSLSDEAAQILSNEDAPTFMARGMNTLMAMFIDGEKIATAFRGDGGLSWGDHDKCLFRGTEWFFRPGYRAYLTSEWIPALDGIEEQLQRGAQVADIGCGHGASAVVMAQAFPSSRAHGYDFHSSSIETAVQRATEAGVGDRAEFSVAGAKEYPGRYSLICFFDCLHDMGDPVGVARYAREHLEADGAVLLVEPMALDDRAANIAENPLAALLYAASSALCTPNSLSQEVGRGLGAQAGEAQLREVFTEAGFTRFRRAAETPLNMILEARP
jgi:2-polyprenyl-3-methyl-5-hydroxy-6-metoxy-1,4-benzoquinol methylase